ncbi:MAG: DDE-type integrase/transposase/recombinase [Oscillospiraceae bacterium]|nr:DDE-type integrase/transposase/recombinase [Oscillospiraceae bacterium]
MARHQNPFQMGQFKFGLIAPVIQGTYNEKSPSAYYRRITKEPLKRPDGSIFRYSPQTLHCWELMYRKGGMDALILQPRTDKGVSRALSGDAINRIYGILEQFPKLPATQVRNKLLEESFITSKVSERCIQRFLKEWRIRAATRGAQKDRKAFEEEYFGALWQADSCHFPYVPGDVGTACRTYLLTIIDDHARIIVAAELFFNDNAANFQKLFKSAVATYGVPNKLFVDHGGPYDNNQIALICGNIGTALIHAAVSDGASKGKIERLFRTVKETWLYGLDISEIKSLDEFNRMLSEFVRSYNLTVHSATSETPMDRFLRTRGRIKAPLSREWLDDCFLNRERRKVRSDGTLQIRNVQFDVPLQFIGQTVDVRFPPDHLDEACIIYDKIKYALRKTNKVENARVKRDNPKINYGWNGSEINV